MANIDLRTFKNRLDVDLIPISNDNIILGTLVWDSLIAKPDFDHPGMPNHILNPFQLAGYLNEDEREKFEDELKTVELGEGEISQWTVDVDFNAATKLDHPRLGKISSSLDFDKVKKFSFDNIKTRIMSNTDRLRIGELLEDLKENNWEDYKGKIRHVFMITELYYGSAIISIDKNFKTQFETNLEEAEIEASAKYDIGRSVTYSFSNDTVPFAMNLERVKFFIP